MELNGFEKAFRAFVESSLAVTRVYDVRSLSEKAVQPISHPEVRSCRVQLHRLQIAPDSLKASSIRQPDSGGACEKELDIKLEREELRELPLSSGESSDSSSFSSPAPHPEARKAFQRSSASVRRTRVNINYRISDDEVSGDSSSDNEWVPEERHSPIDSPESSPVAAQNQPVQPSAALQPPSHTNVGSSVSQMTRVSRPCLPGYVDNARQLVMQKPHACAQQLQSPLTVPQNVPMYVRKAQAIVRQHAQEQMNRFVSCTSAADASCAQADTSASVPSGSTRRFASVTRNTVLIPLRSGPRAQYMYSTIESAGTHTSVVSVADSGAVCDPGIPAGSDSELVGTEVGAVSASDLRSNLSDSTLVSQAAPTPPSSSASVSDTGSVSHVDAAPSSITSDVSSDAVVVSAPSSSLYGTSATADSSSRGSRGAVNGTCSYTTGQIAQYPPVVPVDSGASQVPGTGSSPSAGSGGSTYMSPVPPCSAPTASAVSSTTTSTIASCSPWVDAASITSVQNSSIVSAGTTPTNISTQPYTHSSVVASPAFTTAGTNRMYSPRVAPPYYGVRGQWGQTVPPAAANYRLASGVARYPGHHWPVANMQPPLGRFKRGSDHGAGSSERQQKKRPHVIQSRPLKPPDQLMAMAVTGEGQVALNTGDFLINLFDLHMSYPPIWRLHSGTLLERFDAYETAKWSSKRLYKRDKTYLSMLLTGVECFRKVDARVHGIQRQQFILTEDPHSDKFCKAKADSLKKTGEYLANYEVYVQTFISQALDDNFLKEINEDQDEYFISSLAVIRKINSEHMDRLLELKTWPADVQKRLDTLPLTTLKQLVTQSSSCDFCERRSSPYELQMSGQEYDPLTLKQVNTDGAGENNNNEREGEDSNFIMCTICARLVDTYSQLKHMELKLFSVCKERVKERQTKFPDDDSRAVLTALLEDSEWMNENFKKARNLWGDVDLIYSLLKKSDS